MTQAPITLLLADDDLDDCMFFQDALDEIPVNTKLQTVNDGEQLMSFLKQKPAALLPNMLFLDLNMPRKTGVECLAEIKANEKLSNIPVIIYSTSFDIQAANELHSAGAHYYIRKPGDFEKLKNAIHGAIKIITASPQRPSFANFILQL